MRTTLDLPNELFRQVKARAALDGTSLKALVTRFIEQGLRQELQPAVAEKGRRRSEIPVARKATGQPLPALNNTKLQRVLDDEEVASVHAAAR